MFPTPCYYYDTALLERTLAAVGSHLSHHPQWHMHYAVKANAVPELLHLISRAGFGADCVSGGEVRLAAASGFEPSQIFYAGVGKADWEIDLALGTGIGCFNVESIPELEVIAAIAKRMGKTAPVALRINPDVDAHTHHKITTGLSANKFGIDLAMLHDAIALAHRMENVEFKGLHFHIGSQITEMQVFANLARRINEIQASLSDEERPSMIDVGGGLGVDYENPEENRVADFKGYFQTFREHLHLYEGQTMHCELGRSVVAQCGVLLTRVLFVKQSSQKQFVICDAGMTDLVRPAMYGSYHLCRNLTAEQERVVGTTNMHRSLHRYDVVGPICESSDVFLTDYMMPETRRGDLLCFCSAGAYGETMASQYNSRSLPGCHIF